MTHHRRLSLSILLSFLLLSMFSIGQAKSKPKFEKEDDPAGFEKWFMKSRTPRNTKESAASLLSKATEQKMKLRAEHLRQLQLNRLAGRRPNSVGDASSVWTSLGPSPIVWGTSASESWTGRITTVAVDQTDSTGNTVVVGGAYGGVWRSTNAADPVPGNIKWKALTDDQATLSIGAIAIQPDNGNHIVVGTGEPNSALDSYYGLGLMVSNDAGATWTLVQQTADATPLSFSGKSISGIAFDTRPGHTSNVVAGVASPGTAAGNDDFLRSAIYSSDAGATWHAATINDGGGTLTGSSVMAVVYNPVEDKFFIVVRYHGIYVSTDQGHTFSRLTTQPNSALLSAANCPTATNSATCPVYRAAMAVRYVKPGSETTSADEMYIWMIGFDSSGNTISLNLYQTKNGGAAWTLLDESGIDASTGGDASGADQGWYNLYLGAVPNGAGTDLFAATINIYKCSITTSNPTCAAQPFKNLTHVYDSTCNAFYPNVHPDEHGFDYLGSNPKIAYFGNDGGMYRTLDETKLVTGDCSALNVFDNMNADLGSLTQFIWGSQHPSDPSVLMGGTQDNGTMYVDSTLGLPGTAGWYEVNGGDGGYNWIDATSSATPNYYSAYTGVTVTSCNGSITTCANTTGWNAVVIEGFGFDSVDGDNSAFYTPYILDPQDPTKIIVGTCRIWRGGNTNAAWPDSSLKNSLSHKFNSTLDTACGNDATDNLVSAIAAGGPKTAAGSKVIYAGTGPGARFGGGVFVTKNAGAPGTAPTAWTDISGSINPSGYQVNAVAVDSRDTTGGTAVAGIQGFTGGPGRIWRTTSFGAAWTDITGNLPDVPVNDLLVDPDNSNVIYAGTDIGVFVTSNESTWTEVGPNTVGATGFLPNTTVFHLAMYEKGTDKRLRAWTHGRGAWETILTSTPTGVTVSPASLTFTSNVGVLSAAQTVTVTNNDAVAVTLGTPAFSGTDAADFQIAPLPTCGTTLAASASCILGVQFTPPSAASFAATLSITTSDASTPTLSVTLSGTGTAPTATDFTFDFGTNPTTVSVAAGSSATYNFNIDATPTGAAFNPAITFACSGLPNKTACTFAPASVSSLGAVALTITTVAPSSAAPAKQRADNSHFGSLLAASLAIPGLAFVIPGFSIRSRRKRTWMFLGMMLIVIAFVGMGACGGGSSAPTPNPVPGTTPGTYPVTITGTYGATVHTQGITLTVQ